MGYGFEEILFSVIIYLISGAALFLFIQIMIYSTITVKNYRKRRSLKNRLPAWTDQIDEYLHKKRVRARFHLVGEERKSFRDMLIGHYCGIPMDACNGDLHNQVILRSEDKRRLRMLYRELGFVDEDVDQVKDGNWWIKSVALGRLSRLELNDAEDLALDLLDTEQEELRLSCISYLASLKSRYLDDRLDEVFETIGDNKFNEVVIELLKAEMDIEHLERLAECDVRSGRRAAAIMLGRKGLQHGLAVMRKLASDPFEDVRLEVARSLGRIGTMNAIRVLETMDRDTDMEVRKAALREIKRIRNRLVVTSIWDLEMDDRRTEDLLTAFSNDTLMPDDNHSMMGF
ncbi:MAG: HEAT repeat domain-containing protein [Thermoplasmatota archaeon]